MGYDRQQWIDGAEGGTPLSAARLNHMEAGLDAAADTADDAAASAAAAGETADGALPADGGTATGEINLEGGFAHPHLKSVTADPTVLVTDTGYTATGLETTVTVGSSGRLRVTVTAEARVTVGTGPVRIAADLDAAAAANARSATASSSTWRTVERTAVLTGLDPEDHTVRLAALVTTGGDEAEVRFLSLIADPT